MLKCDSSCVEHTDSETGKKYGQCTVTDENGKKMDRYCLSKTEIDDTCLFNKFSSESTICNSTPDSKPTPEETPKKELYDSCKNNNECLSNFCSKFTFKCKPKECDNDENCPENQYCKKGFHSPRCEDLKTKFCNRDGECRSKKCMNNSLCICRNQNDCESDETCTLDRKINKKFCKNN